MELEDENWRPCSTTLVRGVSAELEDENWRLSSTTLVRGVPGSWKMRTGDFVVQLQYVEQSVELEDENWRLGSATLVRGAICGAGS